LIDPEGEKLLDAFYERLSKAAIRILPRVYQIPLLTRSHFLVERKMYVDLIYI
jgi:hypothetical protein